MADVISTRRSHLAVPKFNSKSKRLDVLTPYFESAKCSASLNPDWFFDYEKLQGKERKSYCNDCPVVAKCLDYALSVKVSGIWGGTTLDERDAIRKERNIIPAMLEFGQPDTFGERFHPNARRRNTKND
jgi:WhiB family redox-sensing transcriptional regulator